ncbi:hypothetical protein GGU11DRAFT_822091 [Lentinula aff. detonsa]|nr:hypothetical protein GGU11DRAFT_822091 [Lentinula aff. detonsa]
MTQITALKRPKTVCTLVGLCQKLQNSKLAYRPIESTQHRSSIPARNQWEIHLRQLHLTTSLLSPGAPKYDVFFVEQLSTCITLLRVIGRTRVVFYCHFPYKLLANGEFIKDPISRAQRNMLKGGLLKRTYRYPMDWLEEITAGQADVILANSNFTGRVFKDNFQSIRRTAEVVYPDSSNDPDVAAILSNSNRPTLISLNRFEKKNNVALAVEACQDTGARTKFY